MYNKMEPIRVAQIIGKWVGGGVEAVIMNYYRNINREKIQFDFFCDDDSTNIPYDEIKKLGGKIVLIPPYQHLWSYKKKLMDALITNNYLIVHSHINTLSVFPLFFAKKAGISIRIAHSHSTTNKLERRKNLLKQLLKPFSKIFATDYFACSELAGRWLFGEMAYDNGEVTIINNAIELNNYRYDPLLRNEIRNELKLMSQNILIGHIGRFVMQKNHSFLIVIFNQLSKLDENVRLLLIGQGPLFVDVKKQVIEYGLQDKVIFLGHQKDAYRYYQAMDIFLLPSLYEGLPVVGIEAQAAGLLCYLSNEVTEETKMLDSTKMMSLDTSANEWAGAILEDFKLHVCKDKVEEITSQGYNISLEACKLENKYLNLLECQ